MKIIINNEVSTIAKDVEIIEGLSNVDLSAHLFIRIIDPQKYFEPLCNPPL